MSPGIYPHTYGKLTYDIGVKDIQYVRGVFIFNKGCWKTVDLRTKNLM